MTNNQVRETNNQLSKEQNVSEKVFDRIANLKSQDALQLPKEYSYANALKEAWLIISQDNKLMRCTDSSKAQALLGMVTQGLNPAKNQCYFIPYGDKMKMQVSTFGKILLTKRAAGAKDVIGQVIYKGDSFKQELDTTGRVISITHDQDFFNIDTDNIIGAYATVVFDDSRQNYIEIMTIKQLEKAWMQSSMIKDEVALEKSKTHGDFKEEMAKKTVIHRATKKFINSSTDSDLVENEQILRKEVLDAEVEEQANQEELDFEQPQQYEDAQFKEVEEPEPADVSNFEEVSQEAPKQESEKDPF